MKIVNHKAFTNKGQPLAFLAQAKVSDVIEQMAQYDYGCAVVVDGEQHVKGIVSERDFLRRLLFEDMDQHEVTLGEIMTPNVRIAYEDDEVMDWLHVMSHEHFRHLPIVDHDGHLRGLISQDDLVAYTWPNLLQKSLRKNYEIFLIAGAFLIYVLAIFVAFEWIF